MKITFKKKTAKSVNNRLKNRARIRKKVSGTDVRPRLCMFRSNKHTYAQIIDDTQGVTIASASTLSVGGGSNIEAAKKIGEAVAKAAMAKNIKDVVFDRSGYVYHGRVKALAEGAREAGLNF
ncbi:MAG: 50S ribosomal protein L18 [Bdellovibrionaceae bacterium]|nr:50S ribosomal protein L18 [Pseudobdellovibrionaceae bacterium]